MMHLIEGQGEVWITTANAFDACMPILPVWLAVRDSIASQKADMHCKLKPGEAEATC